MRAFMLFFHTLVTIIVVGKVLRLCNGYFILKSVNGLLQKAKKVFFGKITYGGQFRVHLYYNNCSPGNDTIARAVGMARPMSSNLDNPRFPPKIQDFPRKSKIFDENLGLSTENQVFRLASWKTFINRKSKIFKIFWKTWIFGRSSKFFSWKSKIFELLDIWRAKSKNLDFKIFWKSWIIKSKILYYQIEKLGFSIDNPSFSKYL